MPVPEGSAGDRLLESLGYFVRWNSWVLQLPEGKEIEAQPLPEGYAIRTRRDRGGPAARCTRSTRTRSSSGRSGTGESFEDFEAKTTRRPGFEPWNLRMVVDPAGDVRRRLLPPARARRPAS